ncbi:MAG: hypothetical protein HY983_00025 [Candidatus Magasanikbacteria bacterium]|nr:hypothetical protein [Candidatus Magasanikbacteria bacterium]
MRYVQSFYRFRQHQPKKGPLSFFKKNKQRRLVVQREEGWGRYSNPFKLKKKIRRTHLAPMALLSLLFAWLALVLYLPYFRVTEVTVTGLKIIKPEEINSLVKTKFLVSGRFWPRNNYFLIREALVAEAIQEKFTFNSIAVTKVFPHAITINLEEKVSSAIYDNGSEYWLLDQEGTPVQYLREVTSTEFELTKAIAPSSTEPTVLGAKINASSTPAASSTIKVSVHIPNFKKIQQEYGKYPLIYDTRNIPVTERQGSIIRPAVVQGIIDFFNGLQQGKIAAIKYMVMSDPTAGVTVITDQPWKILFQPTNAIQPQLENLRIILRDNHPSQYVDVRFGGRIYWK